MYNEERKLEFLNSLSQPAVKQSMGYLLESMSDVEKMLHKDLCDFNYQEFLMLFETKKLVSASTFLTNRSNIKKYIKWCVQQNYCVSNQLEEIDRLEYGDLNTSIRVKFEMYKDEDDLLDCIDKVLDDYDITVRDMFFAFYGLCWYGFSDMDLFTAKAEYVNGNTIKMPDRTIELSDRFAKILHRYLDTDIVFTGKDIQKKMPYVSSDLIIRNINHRCATTEITSNYHSTRYKQWTKAMEDVPITSPYYGRKLKPIKIRYSGAFYRLYRQEQQGERIDESTIFKYLPNKSADPYAGILLNRDYTAWKKAFNL